MRDYQEEFKLRVAFLREQMAAAHASGFIFGNSGGKDSALVGILCKAACDNTLGVILPCASKRNYGEDSEDASALAAKYGIETRIVDLTAVRTALLGELESVAEMNKGALTNIAPRLRMTALYAIGASENRLVVGTGNRCERYVGYFTKWGDGACDLNPISDLTVDEVYAFLRYLDAPDRIIKKAPSAGLFEGQTDEADMGVTYDEIGRVIAGEEVPDPSGAIIARMHRQSAHKRSGTAFYHPTED